MKEKAKKRREMSQSQTTGLSEWAGGYYGKMCARVLESVWMECGCAGLWPLSEQHNGKAKW